MDYIPHSKRDIAEMMAAVGIKDMLELFDTVPPELVLDDERACSTFQSCSLDQEGMTAFQLYNHMRGVESENALYEGIFIGAGCYHHFIPPVVDALASRAEFWTSYTPYQAEFNQGFLQAIFEYQTAITRLTGMKYTNASLHDGATALVDSITMAMAQNKKRGTILIAGNVNPWWMNVVETSLSPRDVVFKEVPWAEVEAATDSDTIAVVMQRPDFLGTVRDVKAKVDAVKAIDKNVITIMAFQEALSLVLLQSPGACGVDIVVGNGQSFGIPMSFGGPGLGIMAVNDKKLLHRMPGRIVGIAPELEGNGEGFTLTLQAREQHIRRERALSNICSNEALNMLRAGMYIFSLGGSGLYDLAEVNAVAAMRLQARINELPGFSMVNEGPVFNEFTMKVPPGAMQVISRECEERGLLGPLCLSLVKDRDEWRDWAVFCTTEMNQAHHVDGLVEACKEAIK